MKKIKKVYLTLMLSFPFIVFSKEKINDIALPTSCDIFISQNIPFDNINADDFITQHAGTLADERYIQTIPLLFKECSRNKVDIKISINQQNIDVNNGYLKNNSPSSLASENITFQLLDEDDNPIDLNQKNNFHKVISNNNDAEFYFSLNYVKKDNRPPLAGEVNANIIFDIFINDELVDMENLNYLD